MKGSFLASVRDFRRGRFSTPGLLLLLVAAFLTAPAGAQETVKVTDDMPLLTLDDCLHIALQDSPTLQIADERQNMAAQDVTGAWGAFLPDLSLSRDWGKNKRTDFDIENQTAVPGYYTYDSAGDSTLWYVSAGNGTYSDDTIHTTYGTWGGRASLNVFSGFSKFANLSSSRNTLKAAEATRSYTRDMVIEDVITAYYNLLRSFRLLEVAIETRDQAAAELERTETYFRLGSTAKSDVLQQRVRLENTKLDVVVANNTVKKAFVDLAFYMNRPLAEGFRIDETLLETDFAIEPVDSLYAEALTNRQDLASSAFTAEARQKDVTSASANLWPRVDVYANYSHSDNESPYRFGSQVSQSTSFGYSVSWNIFDRLQTWTGRSKAKANARIAEYELSQARLNAQVEIRQLHTALIEARERYNVSIETIAQSQEELRLAQERFRVGAGTTLDIIVAQTNLASSRAQEVQAVCDFLIADAQMQRAVGRLGAIVAQ